VQGTQKDYASVKRIPALLLFVMIETLQGSTSVYQNLKVFSATLFLFDGLEYI
jgi:hypothetical protein